MHCNKRRINASLKKLPRKEEGRRNKFNASFGGEGSGASAAYRSSCECVVQKVMQTAPSSWLASGRQLLCHRLRIASGDYHRYYYKDIIFMKKLLLPLLNCRECVQSAAAFHFRFQVALSSSADALISLTHSFTDWLTAPWINWLQNLCHE